MLSTNFSTYCAPNYIQNTDNIITLGNTYECRKKGLECTIAYTNIESGFPNHFLYQLCLDYCDLHISGDDDRYMIVKYYKELSGNSSQLRV